MRGFVFVACVCLTGCDKIPGTNSYKIKQAENTVRYMLIDGESARFREEKVLGSTVCGQVNSKNRMGAYVGFSNFKVENGVADIQDSDNYDQYDECKSATDRFLDRAEEKARISN